MNKRIRELRKALSMTQTEFGIKIGIKQGSIAAYENGIRTPIDAVILSICREFNVSETCLRTGKGEMFNLVDSFDTTYNHFVDLMKNSSAEKKAALSILIELFYHFPDDKLDDIFKQFASASMSQKNRKD